MARDAQRPAAATRLYRELTRPGDHSNGPSDAIVTGLGVLLLVGGIAVLWLGGSRATIPGACRSIVELEPGGRHAMNVWQGDFPTRNSAADGHVGGETLHGVGLDGVRLV